MNRILFSMLMWLPGLLLAPAAWAGDAILCDFQGAKASFRQSGGTAANGTEKTHLTVSGPGLLAQDSIRIPDLQHTGMPGTPPMRSVELRCAPDRAGVGQVTLRFTRLDEGGQRYEFAHCSAPFRCWEGTLRFGDPVPPEAAPGRP